MEWRGSQVAHLAPNKSQSSQLPSAHTPLLLPLLPTPTQSNLYGARTFAALPGPEIGRSARRGHGHRNASASTGMAMAAMAMATTLLHPFSCSIAASAHSLAPSAAVSTPAHLSLRKFPTVSAFRGASFFGCQFALPGAVTKRRRTLVGVVQAKRMASSQDVATRVPDFELVEPLTGKTWRLEEFEPYPALLVMFICNHCPFVIHLKEDIVKLAANYMPKGLAVVAISSNSVVTHPEDGPQFMAEEAKAFGYPFPYLYDETQEVAKAFGAVCTPEFYLYKKDGPRPFELAYHGRFDESRPRSNIPVTGRDIREAIDCVLSGRPVTVPERPSIGCSIKWAPAASNQ